MNRNHFDTLVADYFDDSLTPPDHDELNVALRDDVDLRREFVLQSHLHRQLYDALQTDQASERLSDQRHAAVRSPNSADPQPARTLTTDMFKPAPIADAASPSGNPPPGPSLILGFLADRVRGVLRGPVASPMVFLSIGIMLASLCWGGLGIWITWWRGSATSVGARPSTSMAAEPAEVARLTGSAGCHWKGARSPKLADSLPAGELDLVAGTAELKLSSGVTLLIVGPTRLDLQSPETTYLRAGQLAAIVPPRAVRYTVATPTGMIVDLGTEFGVEVEELGNTAVEVFKGRVRFEPSKTADSATPGGIILEAGKQPYLEIDAASGRVAVRGPSPASSNFAPLAARVSEVHRAAVADARLAALEADHPLALWQISAAQGGIVRNRIGDRNHGLLKGHPQKPGDFDGIDDYVLIPQRPDNDALELPGEFTIEFWFRPVAGGEGIQHMLTKGAQGSDNSVRYTLAYFTQDFPFARAGVVRFNTNTDFRHAIDSKAFVRPGEWMHVAVTYAPDRGGQLKLYINGQLDAERTVLVDSAPCAGEPLVIGAATMEMAANSPPVMKHYFRGELDDVALFDRALTAGQIQAHARAESALAK